MRNNTFIGPGRNAIHARSEIYFTNNTIIGYDVGLLQDYVDGAVWVSENRIEHCSTAGIDVDAQYVDCDHNTVLSCGTGMTLSASVELNARGNVVQSCDAVSALTTFPPWFLKTYPPLPPRREVVNFAQRFLDCPV